MIVAVLTAAAAILLPALCMSNVRTERRRRGEFFADVLALFDRYRVTQNGLNFPVLEGTYRGFTVRLEPVLDDMGVRKIPSLWLKTTLLLPNPRRGVLDFIVRPQGIEFYSPSQDLRKRLDIPTAWPQHAILCTDEGGTPPSLETLTPHISAFDDQKIKELLITPRGVRLVYQAAQAERAEYLVLRQARFAQARLAPAVVARLLDKVIAVATDLDFGASDADASGAEMSNADAEPQKAEAA